MITLKVKGLDEVRKKLDDLAKKAKAIDGKHNIPINELLNHTFVSQHTQFATAEEMFDASGFKLENQDDFAAIPDEKLDDFIRSVSSFQNWQSMLDQAVKDWTAKKLGL
jgi:hypothetical protein